MHLMLVIFYLLDLTYKMKSNNLFHLQYTIHNISTFQNVQLFLALTIVLAPQEIRSGWGTNGHVPARDVANFTTTYRIVTLVPLSHLGGQIGIVTHRLLEPNKMSISVEVHDNILLAVCA
ncbi:hypothetical protein SK128_019675 [Halocaridina rubra]|uniref:Uncharacterized protein n=1 Tax=Halocaridina rubra TaxID=373956 RepID=A0AAN9A7U8_HALRR